MLHQGASNWMFVFFNSFASAKQNGQFGVALYEWELKNQICLIQAEMSNIEEYDAIYDWRSLPFIINVCEQVSSNVPRDLIWQKGPLGIFHQYWVLSMDG